MFIRSSIFTLIYLTVIELFSQCPPSAVYMFTGNAHDSSGHGLSGTVYGATLTENRFGMPNSAYYFDGIDDHISVADDTSNDLGETWTIMAWIKPDNAYGNFKDEHVSIVEKWGNAGPTLAAYCMGIHSQGQLEGFTHNGNIGTYKWSNQTIPTLSWTHIAVTRDRDDSIRLYINSQLVKTYYSTLPQNSKFDLTIGMAADPSIQLAYKERYRFKGVIDDVKLFKCRLQASDFNIDYNKTAIEFPYVKFGPSPSDGIVNVIHNLKNNYSIEVYDDIGRIILKDYDLTVLNLSIYKGIFIIKLTDLANNSTFTQKIVILD